MRFVFKTPFSFSLKDLKEAVYNSNQEVTSVKQLSAIYDYKTWLKPFINTPHNHTAPHNFLFQCNESGSAVMLYRNWSSDEWRPQTPDDELMLLKVFMHNITPVCLGQTACKLELMICFDSNKYTKHDVMLYMYVL